MRKLIAKARVETGHPEQPLSAFTVTNDSEPILRAGAALIEGLVHESTHRICLI